MTDSPNREPDSSVSAQGNLGRTSRRASRGSALLTPLPPHVATASELVFGGRAVDEALDTDSKVRCALTRMSAAVLDGMIERGRANSAKFIIDGIAQRLDREFEREMRLKEFELGKEQVAEARHLAVALEEYRSRAPASLIQQVAIHVPALLAAAAAGEERVRPALEASGDSGEERL